MFDSVTELLESVEQPSADRFLQRFTSQIATSDATASFLLDPDAHGSQTVHRFLALFDAVTDVRD